MFVMKFLENSKKLWKHSFAAPLPTAFLILPNLHSCFSLAGTQQKQGTLVAISKISSAGEMNCSCRCQCYNRTFTQASLNCIIWISCKFQIIASSKLYNYTLKPLQKWQNFFEQCYNFYSSDKLIEKSTIIKETNIAITIRPQNQITTSAQKSETGPLTFACHLF